MTVYQKTAATATVCLVLGLGAAACKKTPAVSPPPPASSADCAGQTPGTASAAAPRRLPLRLRARLTDDEIIRRRSRSIS